MRRCPYPSRPSAPGPPPGALGSYIPATSFQYKNVGVNLSLTPRVAASGDITLEFAAEFSIIGGNQNVGSVKDPLFVPTFLTRNVTGVLRLRDGEAAMIGGLVQSNETVDAAGVLGIGSIPILGKLFGTHKRQFKDSEVVISMTPRVVRAPKLVESDFKSLRVGTQEVPKVEGARPGLFGKEPEAPEAGADARRGRGPGARDETRPGSGGRSCTDRSDLGGSARPGPADGTPARGRAGGIARSAGGGRRPRPPPCRPRRRRSRGR